MLCASGSTYRPVPERHTPTACRGSIPLAKSARWKVVHGIHNMLVENLFIERKVRPVPRKKQVGNMGTIAWFVMFALHIVPHSVRSPMYCYRTSQRFFILREVNIRTSNPVV